MSKRLNHVAVLLAAFLMSFMGLAHAQERLDWELYVNPIFNYEILIPTGAFQVQDEDGNPAGITLFEVGGRGQIDIYGAENSEGLTSRQFAQALGRADRIREITYSRIENGWFVLSGYYRREGDSSDDLIFYTKFMFNADRSALSAFEASYPVGDKELYDPIVTRLEKSLTSPRGSYEP